jgi:hypothetical protein
MARDICARETPQEQRRQACARQARAPPLLLVAVWTLTRIECTHSLELPSFRQALAKSASTFLASKSSSSPADDEAGSDGGKPA